MQEVTRRRWRLGLWWTAVLLTTAHGVLVAWLAREFFFLGDSADTEDYLVAAGVLTAAALALGAGACTAAAPAHRRWAQPGSALAAAALAGLLAVAALVSLVDARRAGDPVSGGGLPPFPFGFGQLLLMPWAWLLLWAGGRGIWSYVRR